MEGGAIGPRWPNEGPTGTSASPAAADGSGDGSVDGVAEVRGLGWFLAGTSSSLVNTPTWTFFIQDNRFTAIPNLLPQSCAHEPERRRPR